METNKKMVKNKVKGKFNFVIEGKKGERKVRIVKKSFSSLTKDHIIPKSFFKDLRKGNIQLITSEENHKKGNNLV